ncbi:MAG TPA: hypothetical protein VMI31_03420 [Fimbriimonadaceae bacterium]|nr:hypothetical protein [Fimbriimonadaceae bacterium]
MTIRAIVAGALLCFAVFVLWPRDPYAFLERFHPRHVNIDARANPFTIGSPLPPMTRVRMLVFSYRDSTEIIDSIRRELTPRRGFWPSPWNAEAYAGGIEAQLVYSREPTRFMGAAMGPPGNGLLFLCGGQAEMERQYYESGSVQGWTEDPKACIVLIGESPTWFEEVWRRWTGH